MVVLNFIKINLINHLFVMLQMWSMTDTDENIHLFPLLLFCLCQILGHFFLIPQTDYSITVTNQNKQSWSGWSWWQPWADIYNLKNVALGLFFSLMKERALWARRGCVTLKTKRGYFRRRSTAGVFAVFGQNPISKIKHLYMSDHGGQNWIENRIPGSSKVTVMYLDFQSIDFVSRANYMMVCNCKNNI